MALSVDLSAVTASDATFSASGATAWLTVKDRTASLAGIASAAQGGTGIAYFQAAGPSVARTYTFPDADATILYSGGPGGTPASLVGTNITGTAAGLSIGGNAATVTTNANLTGIVTSTGNATAIADKAISYTKLADGTDGNLITWDASGVAALVATGTATHVLTSNGAGTAPTFQAAAGGAATLDGITAATADEAGIANADWNVVWNWQKTTDAEVAFTYGETAAATNGTSTSGVPNQVLLKLATLAASTMSPLSVYSRAAHVFSVSPTTAQVFATAGSAAAPPYSFAAAAGMGAYTASGLLLNAVGGAFAYGASTTQFLIGSGTTTGSFAAPAISGGNNFDTGIALLETSPSTTDFVGIAVAGLENTRWPNDQSVRMSKGSADAVSYAMNFRKSRGTVASPTVITTADDLATISGAGYVGATGTYVEGCRITFDSTGTIANTTSGMGGIIRFSTSVVGTVGVTEALAIQGGNVPQLLAANGTAAAPAYSFAALPDTGVYGAAGPLLIFAAGGSNFAIGAASQFRVSSNGTVATPTLTLGSTTDYGWSLISSTDIVVSLAGSETTRTLAGAFRASKGTADAVSYALNFRKSRGSVESPTVITTADVLSTISAYAYLGATNTYRETGRTEFKSKGTISDATTGVGSIYTVYGKTQGTDVTVVPTLVITDGSTATIKFAGTGMFTANGSTIATIGSTCPGSATVVKWFTFTDDTGTVCYVPCF